MGHPRTCENPVIDTMCDDNRFLDVGSPHLGISPDGSPFLIYIVRPIWHLLANHLRTGLVVYVGPKIEGCGAGSGEYLYLNSLEEDSSSGSSFPV